MDDRALKLPMVFKCFFFLSKITELKIEGDTSYAKKGKGKGSYTNFKADN